MTDSNVKTPVQLASVLRPWLKYYPESSADLALPKMTMYEMVKANCTVHGRGSLEALFYYGTKITYEEMQAKIEQYAAAFQDFGIKKGEFVSIISVPVPETIYALYGLNKLGAVCNFIDPRTDTPHTREFIRKAGSRVVIAIEQVWPRLRGALDELGLDLVICQDITDSLPVIKRIAYNIKTKKTPVDYDGKRVIKNKDFIKRGAGKTATGAPYEPDFPAIVTRTGGTTGVSKGVVLTNDNMNAEAVSFIATDGFAGGKRTLLNFLPIAASYGIAVGVHSMLAMGARDILIPMFDINEFDSLVLKYKPNHIIGVPVFYEQLIYSKKLQGVDMSFIGTMAAGGDSASEALEDKLDEFRLAHNIEYPIAQGYGMSEASSAVSFGIRDIHRKGSAGIPIPGNIIAAFKPGTTEELPIGDIGEICITGATVMKEYLNEPEETANILHRHPDGRIWIHSGDLGRVDEDGFVYIVGRIKRSIIRFDGHKVYPLQIENTVLQHEYIANCAVVGVKDKDHIQGSLPLICAQLTDHAPTNSAQKAEIKKELLQLCRDELELRSQPCDVVFVEKIPLTQLMKNDARSLEAKYSNYDYATK